MNNANYQRWYDVDPTLSLAISFLRNVSIEQQTIVAQIIIEKATALGAKLSGTKTLFSRRWYDEEETMSDAMDLLRQVSKENRKQIALEMIDYLTQIKQ